MTKCLQSFGGCKRHSALMSELDTDNFVGHKQRKTNKLEGERESHEKIKGKTMLK